MLNTYFCGCLKIDMSNKADTTSKYKEYKELNFPAFETEILQFWKENLIFEKSIENR